MFIIVLFLVLDAVEFKNIFSNYSNVFFPNLVIYLTYILLKNKHLPHLTPVFVFCFLPLKKEKGEKSYIELFCIKIEKLSSW